MLRLGYQQVEIEVQVSRRHIDCLPLLLDGIKHPCTNIDQHYYFAELGFLGDV
jgi:hypothetical protein